MSMAAMTVIMFSISGCTKDEVHQHVPASKSEQKAEIADFDELHDFIAWAVQVPKESIKFDSLNNEFFIPDSEMRESIEKVRTEYQRADAYKGNIEKL